MLRSTELNTIGMTNTIYIVTTCVAPTGGNLSIKGAALRGDKMAKHLYESTIVIRLYWFWIPA